MAYISQADRDKIPLSDFADPKNRKYPIRNQDELDSAATLYGKAPNPDQLKRRIIAIAHRKKLTLPEAWQTKAKQNPKIKKVMHEWKHGQLHSGSAKGPRVTNRKQAIAIALSEAAQKETGDLATKAPNYHARAGQAIAGRLTRGKDGKFASASGGMTEALQKMDEAKSDRERLAASLDYAAAAAENAGPKPKGKGGGKKGGGGKGKKTPQDKAKIAGDNLDKMLGKDLSEAVSLMMVDPQAQPNPDIAKQLLDKGIIELDSTGKYRFSSAGRGLIAAAVSGDQRRMVDSISRGTDRAKKKAKKEVANKEGHTGAMVAFFLPPEVAQAISIPGGEPVEDLHLTLAYLGDTQELDPNFQTAIDTLLRNFAATTATITGVISGVGVFNAPPGCPTPFYASFDSAALPWFRQNLIQALESTGVQVVQNHGFTPHITLSYLPEGSALPTVVPPALPLTFSTLSFCWGDVRTDYELVPVATKDQDGGLMVFKTANGRYRWITFSSSSYEDQDGEIVSQKAQEADCARMAATKEYGPLCWWHMNGMYGEKKLVKLGDCDLSEMVGRIRVESGTFVNDQVAEKLAQAQDLGVSLGFEHKETRRGPGVVFRWMATRERSLLPKSRASNLLTELFVKETNQMSKLDALKALLGGGKEAEKAVAEITTEVANKEKQGEELQLAFKAGAKPDASPLPDKGAMMEEKADGAMDMGAGTDTGAGDQSAGDTQDTTDDNGDEEYVTDMTVDALHQALDKRIADAVQTALAPIMEILTASNATASKETNAFALAIKETAAALVTVQSQNEAAVKRIGELETVVKELAGTVKELNGELPKALKGYRPSIDTETVVKKEKVPKPPENPDLAAASRLVSGVLQNGFGNSLG